MIDQRPIDPKEVTYNLRALARQLRRNARLVERLYTDESMEHARQLNGAADIAETWISEILRSHTANESTQ